MEHALDVVFAENDTFESEGAEGITTDAKVRDKTKEAELAALLARREAQRTTDLRRQVGLVSSQWTQVGHSDFLHARAGGVGALFPVSFMNRHSWPLLLT